MAEHETNGVLRKDPGSGCIRRSDTQTSPPHPSPLSSRLVLMRGWSGAPRSGSTHGVTKYAESPLLPSRTTTVSLVAAVSPSTGYRYPSHCRSPLHPYSVPAGGVPPRRARRARPRPARRCMCSGGRRPTDGTSAPSDASASPSSNHGKQRTRTDGLSAVCRHCAIIPIVGPCPPPPPPITLSRLDRDPRESRSPQRRSNPYRTLRVPTSLDRFLVAHVCWPYK